MAAVQPERADRHDLPVPAHQLGVDDASSLNAGSPTRTAIAGRRRRRRRPSPPPGGQRKPGQRKPVATHPGTRRRHPGPSRPQPTRRRPARRLRRPAPGGHGSTDPRRASGPGRASCRPGAGLAREAKPFQHPGSNPGGGSRGQQPQQVLARHCHPADVLAARGTCSRRPAPPPAHAPSGPRGPTPAMPANPAHPISFTARTPRETDGPQSLHALPGPSFRRALGHPVRAVSPVPARGTRPTRARPGGLRPGPRPHRTVTAVPGTSRQRHATARAAQPAPRPAGTILPGSLPAGVPLLYTPLHTGRRPQKIDWNRR